jgi:hypothetical protein
VAISAGDKKAMVISTSWRRQHKKAALLTLMEIADHGENESARVAAANSLLDRGWGRPAQAIHAEVAEKTPREMTEPNSSAALHPSECSRVRRGR